MHDLLAGLRVVEYARGLGAAYCGRLLADAGAEVIAVEPPGGSAVRRLGPFAHDTPGPERGLPFLHCGVNKRSVTLALDDPQGRELFLRLIAEADVLIEDTPPGELAALGIDDAATARARPGLIWTSLTPFGRSGPYRDYAATSLTLQALSAWLGLTGDPNREPLQAGGRLAELAPGLTAAAGTVAELLDLEAENVNPSPRRVDVSILEAMTSFHPPHELAASYLRATGREHRVQRTGNRLPSTHPFSILPCKDGYVGVITLTFTQWELLCRMMGIEALLDDPELQTSAGRVTNAARVDAAMAPWLMARTAEQCFHEAQAWRIPFSLVPDVAAILASPQHAARGLFAEINHFEAGTYLAPGPAFHPTDGERGPQRPAPRLGGDNAALHARLGLRPDEIAALAERGVM